MHSLRGNQVLYHKDVEMLLGMNNFRFSPDNEDIIPYAYWVSGHVNFMIDEPVNKIERHI